MDVSFVPFGPGLREVEDAVTVYTDTWRREWRSSLDFFQGYLYQPDFRGLLARSERGDPVAMTFGVRSRPGMWWHDRVAHEVGKDHPALVDAFAVVELAVREGWRGQGLGARLLAALLASQPCARAVLSAAATNHGAQRFYLRHGWTYMHERGFVFGPGQAPYVVMGRELYGPSAGAG